MADGSEPAAANEDTAQAPLSLKARLAAIRDECFGIGKQAITMQSAKGADYTIRAHTVEAILAEIRPLFAKHGVDLTPNLVERVYTGNRCDVLIDFTFERTDDSDETRVIRWAGAGTDNGDKGFAKAGTNALKELLKKRFLVTDRDDAKEETESVEHRTDDGVNREELEKAKDFGREALLKWASTFKAAVQSATIVKDVERLERDNKAQLTSEFLPDVTRTFLIEMLVKRKAELKAATT